MTAAQSRRWFATLRMRLAALIAGSDPHGATRALQTRHEQLIDSHMRILALRTQLANAEQLATIGQTAANVAHQVGTPLNLISGYVQLVKEEVGADSPLLPRVAVIEEQIAKLTATVRTLLDRSRQVGPKTRTTAGTLVNRVLEVLGPNLHAAKIALVVEGSDENTALLVNATSLELMLLNVMTNAIDAMPAGGALTIRLERTGPMRVAITVSDTGDGINAELVPRIFEPWVSTKKGGDGTGLGLAIARDVISAHGGSITVASEVGRGTTFTIELPADSGQSGAVSR
jgi:two-component system, NtrC family, sensor kinase